jgi:hypothetical protein
MKHLLLLLIPMLANASQTTVSCSSYEPSFIQLSVTFAESESHLNGTYTFRSPEREFLPESGNVVGYSEDGKYDFTFTTDGTNAPLHFSIAVSDEGVISAIGSIDVDSEFPNVALNCTSK